ncbi:RNA polymerase sporulation sigma factor SigH [Clostridium sp. Marseille-P299]|uniref:RNA polymerase sporulation sigma factor SigH n=1 Tax=Clostridium sp. Marseille-P299 TaxID=1805477 RepID=UPI000833676A|nr:RNA polymerase sporulation sigma factor SigH [Clostridium sp. Marseille-P299]
MIYQQYENISDEDIVMLIREGDTLAMDYLIGKYKNLVRKKAKALYLIGGDHEDLIQEGMIGLYKAIRDYQREKEASFLTFADLCISRQIYTAIKSSNTKKNQPLNNYISIDSSNYSDDVESTDSAVSFIETLAHARIMNPEEMFIDKENTSLLEKELYERLSNFERQILNLYMQDYNYSKIAEILNKEPKSVDNALQRIRKKLNQILKEI